jgi:hypothetical protein
MNLKGAKLHKVLCDFLVLFVFKFFTDIIERKEVPAQFPQMKKI